MNTYNALALVFAATQIAYPSVGLKISWVFNVVVRAMILGYLIFIFQSDNSRPTSQEAFWLVVMVAVSITGMMYRRARWIEHKQQMATLGGERDKARGIGSQE